ncbi:hypothetical protein NI17_021680 [Thermobifida halotolerans]|uniref:Uncharacterized protein n=1 Tax=Thermobifida halotolerans TaxID=483545 RepID=A0AA97LW86_9ACTN|nr:hypothetical protein [Thermobifida halotolerans]UOE19312.1 hypothetical protein NI17_021680 [Thermobifida halotolerans]
MLPGLFRRQGYRPRHALPSRITRVTRVTRVPLSPRWLVASLVVLALGGMAALLSPHPEQPAAQPTAAAVPSSAATYFAPSRTATPASGAVPAARPLTRTVVVRTAALSEAGAPSPSPAAAADDSPDTSEATEQSSPDRWSPQRPAEQEGVSDTPSEEERCDGSFLTLWPDCPEERGN